MDLNEKKLFKSEDIIELREKINEELRRRSYEGSLASYAEQDNFNNQNKPIKENYTYAYQHNNLLNSLERIVGKNFIINGQRMPDDVYKGDKIDSIQIMLDLVNKLSKEERQSGQSSCHNYCSGLCKTTCSTNCGSDCSNSCRANCADNCTDGCQESCFGSCHAQCAGGCGAQCTNSDGCFGSCTGRSTCGNLCAKMSQ